MISLDESTKENNETKTNIENPIEELSGISKIIINPSEEKEDDKIKKDSEVLNNPVEVKTSEEMKKEENQIFSDETVDSIEPKNKILKKVYNIGKLTQDFIDKLNSKVNIQPNKYFSICLFVLTCIGLLFILINIIQFFKQPNIFIKKLCLINIDFLAFLLFSCGSQTILSILSDKSKTKITMPYLYTIFISIIFAFFNISFFSFILNSFNIFFSYKFISYIVRNKDIDLKMMIIDNVKSIIDFIKKKKKSYSKLNTSNENTEEPENHKISSNDKTEEESNENNNAENKDKTEEGNNNERVIEQ